MSSSSRFSRSTVFKQEIPLHWPQAGVHFMTFFLHEQVFLSQFPLQLHQIILSRDAGAGAFDIRMGIKALANSAHPQSTAEILLPHHSCT